MEETAEPAAPAKRTRSRRKAVQEEAAPVAAEPVELEPPLDLTTAEAAEVAASLLLTMPADEPLDDEPAGEEVVEEGGRGCSPTRSD
nr:hypothetical protein GCM10020093_047410 [Planobispora longispora]